MAIAFESLYSDIAGRCGKLTVGKKIVRTPALLPVINPHLQPGHAKGIGRHGYRSPDNKRLHFFPEQTISRAGAFRRVT